MKGVKYGFSHVIKSSVWTEALETTLRQIGFAGQLMIYEVQNDPNAYYCVGDFPISIEKKRIEEIIDQFNQLNNTTITVETIQEETKALRISKVMSNLSDNDLITIFSSFNIQHYDILGYNKNVKVNLFFDTVEHCRNAKLYIESTKLYGESAGISYIGLEKSIKTTTFENNRNYTRHSS